MQLFSLFPDLFLFYLDARSITRLGPLPLDVDATLAQIRDVGEGGRAQIERAIRATGALVLNLINVWRRGEHSRQAQLPLQSCGQLTTIVTVTSPLGPLM